MSVFDLFPSMKALISEANLDDSTIDEILDIFSMILQKYENLIADSYIIKEIVSDDYVKDASCL